MKWKLTSQYSVSDGRFHIAMAYVMGKRDFMLWDREKIIGHWPTQEEAKNAAADLRNTERGPASAGLVRQESLGVK